MTKTNTCILTDYRTDACASCTQLCAHRINLNGLTGDGGRVASAGIPADYRNVTIGTSPVRESQTEIYATLDRYVDTYKRQLDGGERVKSLYLWSESPGTGKTTTAIALLNAWIATTYLTAIKDGKQPTPVSAYFLDVNEWQTDYNNFNRPRVPDSIAEPAADRYYKAMGLAKNAKFAVLDDIGVRDASENFRADLHTIINHRTVSGIPTVYTSNLPIESPIPESKRITAHKPYDIKDVFDARLFDRIRDMCNHIPFKGTSKRGRR